MKTRLLTAIICAAMMLVSCGTTENSSEQKALATSAQTASSADSRSSSQGESLSQAEGTTSHGTQSVTVQSGTPDSDRQVYSMTINNDKKPELTKVEFSGKCDGDIERKASLSESRHVLHNSVVGLVGSPIEVEYKDVDDPQIAFYYNKSELRGIPEKNLILLYCTKENEPYNTVEGAKPDTEKCMVSAKISGQGVYLLADAYQWYSAWGYDVSEYKYDTDKTDYMTDWEREFNTGSIMKLADKDWAKKNAPDFHVSTAQQLASAVYYVNGINPTYNKVSITLENNIDLTGYDWRPMGWNKANNHCFCGTVNGKGHTIKGMKINLGYEPCGFIGYGWDMSMHDIKFVGAEVSGTHSTGIACGEAYGDVTITNVSVQGKVSGGGNDFGAIIGREGGLAFKGCSANVTADGKPFKYFSYKQKQKAETKVVEYFHLTRLPDGVIVRDHHDGFDGLGWTVELDGQQILNRSTTNPKTGEQMLELETEYQWLKGTDGRHTIYLTAYINGACVRVSNIIEYNGTGL